MTKSFAAAASLLFAIPALASVANAQPRHAFAAQMLQRVQQAQSRVHPGATVARQGTLQVKATFSRKTVFSLPLRCEAEIIVVPAGFGPSSDIEPSDMSQSDLVTFNGRLGTCSVSINYNWPNIDPNSLLLVSLSVIPDSATYYRNGNLKRPVADPITIFDSWMLNSTPTIPASGTTTFDFGQLTL